MLSSILEGKDTVTARLNSAKTKQPALMGRLIILPDFSQLTVRHANPIKPGKAALPGVRVTAVQVLASPGLLGALDGSLRGPGIEHFRLIP